METKQTVLAGFGTVSKSASLLVAGDKIAHATGRVWLVLALMLAPTGIIAVVIDDANRADGTRICDLDRTQAVSVVS